MGPDYDAWAEFHGIENDDDLEQFWNDDVDDSMDGDHDSAMRDAGWGCDEDYGFFGSEDY